MLIRNARLHSTRARFGLERDEHSQLNNRKPIVRNCRSIEVFCWKDQIIRLPPIANTCANKAFEIGIKRFEMM